MDTKREKLRQRADLTFKANRDRGRHGWLRLTPAYSMKLVKKQLAGMPDDTVVLEPFAGSGTTPLVSQELGLTCEAREINPFLVWFGNAKLDEYPAETVAEFVEAAGEVRRSALDAYGDSYWKPPLYKIEKWWNAPTLSALSAIKHFINVYAGKVRNLLDISFCRAMISTSSAAFNHQSMSFKSVTETVAGAEHADYDAVISAFMSEVSFIEDSLSYQLKRTSFILSGNSTEPFGDDFMPADIVITSPPYCNRMSYIRELRPYMYWLGFLSSGAEAGDLDWKTTGGTWGNASSKLKSWTPEETIPINDELEEVCAQIVTGKSGEILSPYVRKYFYDMWHHFEAITPVVKPGGCVCYIVGNSTFSGFDVPTQKWYSDMLESLGYEDVHADVIRKRNSNKKLYEYAVWATRP